MRKIIQQQLAQKNIDFFALPLVARLLLVTDGTVTELLEAMLGEPLKLCSKQQDKNTNDELTLKRKVVLCGKQTDTPWLYAESLLFTQALPFSIQQQLEHENVPIGTIFQQLKSDTHREMLDCGYATHQQAAVKLDLPSDYLFLFRRYHIVAQHAPLMQICEWFPYERIRDTMSH